MRGERGQWGKRERENERWERGGEIGRERERGRDREKEMERESGDSEI